MALRHSDVIEVKRAKGKGRGVFARRLIRQGEVIERVPVLLRTSEEVKEPERWTGLALYCFEWGEGMLALALGYNSLYNHSYQPNARFDDQGGQTMVFTAIRDITPGEEIVVNYNAKPLKSAIRRVADSKHGAGMGTGSIACISDRWRAKANFPVPGFLPSFFPSATYPSDRRRCHRN
jgi:uncharacterized protein